MPIAFPRDRDDLLARPADAGCPPYQPTPDDTGTHDLADLWMDLGGGD